jgi:hypothetical protein
MSAGMLIDTDVLIWYLRGYPQAARFIDGVTDLRLSSITYMELIQGCRNGQEMAQMRIVIPNYRIVFHKLFDSGPFCPILKSLETACWNQRNANVTTISAENRFDAAYGSRV